MSNWYEPATQADAPKGGATLPPVIRFDFSGGKIQANMVKRALESLQTMASAGEAGFHFWDHEDKRAIRIPKFEAVILGTFWKVKTFTGNGAEDITSSNVLDIKRDVMTLYKSGEKAGSGLYSDLKENFPSKETRAYRFLLCFSPKTGKLITIQLSNTVDNAVKRAFFALENPGKPVQSKANLWSIDGNHERFFVLVYRGELEMLDADGASWSKGEGYIAPVLSIAKVTPTGAPEVFEQAHAAKDSYIGVLQERLAGKRSTNNATADAPATENGGAFAGWKSEDSEEVRDLFERTFGKIEAPAPQKPAVDDEDLPF